MAPWLVIALQSKVTRLAPLDPVPHHFPLQVVSAITKKRLALKSVQTMRQSKDALQVQSLQHNPG